MTKTVREFDPPGVECEASHSHPTTLATQSGSSELVPPSGRLLDRFELGPRLGAGGMGVVYEAMDHHLGVPVALKFLHRFGPRSLYRLKREFRAMNALEPHPNLITPSGLFCQHGVWFVSMELVRGEPFLRFVRPGHELDSGRLHSALAQLASGLCAMHAAGVVHRDLKPSNVLITSAGRLVILDFGLVSDVVLDVRADTEQGLSGTPHYMAPEQARGEPTTEASDWYSVGVMLYEALTGTSPFDTASVDARSAKQERDPLSPEGLVPESARHLAQLCIQLLSREPGQRPPSERVLALLGHHHTSRVAPPQAAGSSALVGRNAELAVLGAAFRRTDLGAPQIVLIEGESGIGKSALVEAFIAARQQGAVVLTGRCHARADVPFKACDGLIDELSRFLNRAASEDAQRWSPQDIDALTQMFPVLGRVSALQGPARRRALPTDAHELRRLGEAALRELLGRIATEQPVVMFIDDLQWGDADSAALLRELLRAPGAPPLLFIGAYRSEARDRSEFVRTVRGLVDESGFKLQTLALGALSQEDAISLAESLLGGAHEDAVAASIAREAAGMPLFVRELSAQAQQGILGDGPGQGVLAAAIGRRVASLPPLARRVLELVSVAHAPLPESIILDAAQLGSDAPTAVRVLSAQALLRVTSDGRLDAYHDRVRECVAAGIEVERKRTLYAALASALQRSERGQADWLAAHALSAGMTELGLRATLEAADDAMRKLAFDRAATSYRTALELLADGDAKHGELLVRLGDACRLDGRGHEAGDAYARAAELVAGLDRIDLLRRASQMYLYSAYVDRGIDVMLPVLAKLRLPLPRLTLRTRVVALLDYVAAGWLQRRFQPRDEAALDRAVLARIDACFSLGTGLIAVEDLIGRAGIFLIRCLRLALRAGAQGRAAYVQCVLAASPTGAKQLERRSRPIFEQHLAFAASSGDPALEAWIHVCAAVSHIHVLQPNEAIACSLRAQQVCADSNIFAGFTLVSAEQSLRIGLMLAGRLGELGRVASEHARRSRARSDLYAWSSARVYAALATLASNQPERALEELSDAIGFWSRSPHWQRWRESSGTWPNGVQALWIRSWALIYQGRAREAHEALVASWSELRGLIGKAPFRLFLTWTRGAAALGAAHDVADRARALRDVRWCMKHLRIKDQPAAAPMIASLGAGLSAVLGDLAAARSQLAVAHEGFDAIGMALFAASSRRRLGEFTDGDAGLRMVRAEDQRLRELGVAVPERWVSVCAPGFE